LRFVTYLSKVPKIAHTKFVDPVTASASKEAEFYVNFKNINLP
jgi:hypothetical protein